MRAQHAREERAPPRLRREVGFRRQDDVEQRAREAQQRGRARARARVEEAVHERDVGQRGRGGAAGRRRRAAGRPRGRERVGERGEAGWLRGGGLGRERGWEPVGEKKFPRVYSRNIHSYEPPAGLSAAGRDFLARLLVTGERWSLKFAAGLSTRTYCRLTHPPTHRSTADPAARASVSQAVKHAWFQEGLIPGAAMVNTMLVQESKAAAPGAEELEEIRGTLREAQRAAPGGAAGAPPPGTGTLGEVRCDMGRYSRVFK